MQIRSTITVIIFEAGCPVYSLIHDKMRIGNSKQCTQNGNVLYHEKNKLRTKLSYQRSFNREVNKATRKNE
uniref:Ovule protein n=1 Tax=Caenorhabditis tropicalis TaxID=1561998 RepID=A0A1I7UX40_9PELO